LTGVFRDQGVWIESDIDSDIALVKCFSVADATAYDAAPVSGLTQITTISVSFLEKCPM
jgi:hypothetical protein